MPLRDELWPQVLAWENLLLAYRKARRGKTRQVEVQRFTFDLERQLTTLRRSLLERTYGPGAFRHFQVVDRKPRWISAAPFRDRVVQHAVMNIVEPRVDRGFIVDSYASRRGKGVHAAVRRYRDWAQRYRYVLKVDVARYFDSIDHRRLQEKLAQAIPDENILWLLNRIIDSSPEPQAPCIVVPEPDEPIQPIPRRVGLPLGNITSQFFGNLYLNTLDNLIKDQLGVKAYLRYVDDLILLSNSKAELWQWCAAIEDFLRIERLSLHPRKRSVSPVQQGLDVLGYRVFPQRTQLSRGSGYRFRRRLKELAVRYATGQVSWEEIDARVQGWRGHAVQADTLGLRRAIFGSVCFRRGEGSGPSPGGSGRVVEQRTAEPAFVEPQQEQAR